MEQVARILARRIAGLFLVLSLLIPVTAPATTSANLDLVGCIPGETADLALEGDFAFCATRSGLLVLDLAGGADPVPVGFLPMPDDARGIAVRAGLAYLAPEDVGLRVVDVSDPTAPFEIGSCPLPGGYGGDIVLGVAHAFVAHRYYGVRVFDISDPGAPAVVSFLPLSHQVRDLELVGDTLYAAGDNAGLRIIDVSDPTHPILTQTFDVPGSVRGVRVRDDYAFLSAGGTGMHVVDLGGEEPVLVGGCSLDFDFPYGTYNYRMDLAGDYAFAALADHGIGVVNIADPTRPVEVTYLDLPGWARRITIRDGFAHLGCLFGGFTVVDIFDPKLPVQTGHYGLVGWARDLRVEDGLVYLAGGYAPPEEKGRKADGGTRVYSAAGLFILDPVDPAWPEILSFGQTYIDPIQLAVGGGYAYLADYLAGVRIFDVSDPNAPEFVYDIYEMGAIFWEVEVAGDYLYAISDWHGLQIFDVTDPALPVEVGSCDELIGYHLDVQGAYVYGSAFYDGFCVFDVSDPAAPAVVSTLPLSGYSNGVFAAGDRVYMANSLHGLVVFDVSDPLAPVELGSFPTPDYAQAVFVVGDLAYVAALEAGVRIIDVSDPQNMQEVAFNGLPRSACSVAVAGDLVYVTSSRCGLYVLEQQVAAGLDPVPPANLALRQNYPNPFNPSTTICFDLPDPARVDLRVYDVSGRLVRVLLAGEALPAGRHETMWNGRDGAGLAVGAGVYFYRLEAGAFTQTRCMTLLK